MAYAAAVLVVLAARAASAPILDEDAVLAAAVRYEIGVYLDAAGRGRGTVLCVGINPGAAEQTASREFLARFQDPDVRGLGECHPGRREGVEAMSGRPAVLVTAGPIETVAADEAWVDVRYFRTKRDSGLETLRVVKEPDGWVALGPVYRDGPQ